MGFVHEDSADPAPPSAPALLGSVHRAVGGGGAAAGQILVPWLGQPVLLQHPWCPRCLPVPAEGTTLLSGLPRARCAGAHRPDVAAREGAAVIAWQSFLIPLQES